MAGDRESAVPDLKTNVPHSARIADAHVHMYGGIAIKRGR